MRRIGLALLLGLLVTSTCSAGCWANEDNIAWTDIDRFLAFVRVASTTNGVVTSEIDDILENARLDGVAIGLPKGKKVNIIQRVEGLSFFDINGVRMFIPSDSLSCD